MAVVVVPGEPKVTQRDGGNDGSGCSVGEGSLGSWTGVRVGDVVGVLDGLSGSQSEESG